MSKKKKEVMIELALSSHLQEMVQTGLVDPVDVMLMAQKADFLQDKTKIKLSSEILMLI